MALTIFRNDYHSKQIFVEKIKTLCSSDHSILFKFCNLLHPHLFSRELKTLIAFKVGVNPEMLKMAKKKNTFLVKKVKKIWTTYNTQFWVKNCMKIILRLMSRMSFLIFFDKGLNFENFDQGVPKKWFFLQKLTFLVNKFWCRKWIFLVISILEMYTFTCITA